MADKPVQRKAADYSLYAKVDDAGAFPVTPYISTQMADIEQLIEEDKVDEFNQGLFYGIQEILAAPIGMLNEVLDDLLEKIYLESDEGATVTTDKEDEKEKKPVKIVEVPDITDEEMEEQLADEEMLTEEELDAWHKTVKPSWQVTNWNRLTLDQKYNIYTAYEEQIEQDYKAV